MRNGRTLSETGVGEALLVEAAKQRDTSTLEASPWGAGKFEVRYPPLFLRNEGKAKELALAQQSHRSQAKFRSKDSAEGAELVTEPREW